MNGQRQVKRRVIARVFSISRLQSLKPLGISSLIPWTSSAAWRVQEMALLRWAMAISVASIC